MAIVFCGCGCGKNVNSDLAVEHSFLAEERSSDARYLGAAIDIEGTVLGEDLLPIAGAVVRTIAWGEAAENDDRVATTDAGGRFVIAGLVRRSILLSIEAPGFYEELVAVDLHRPLDEAEVEIEAVILYGRRDGLLRFMFGGDSMFGRRFVDRDEDGIEGEPEDLIRPGSRAEDAKALMIFFRPILSSADYTQVNLETPMSADPVDKHPYTRYLIHSHSDTLAALPFAGIDAVSLGNNHIFDLLDSGMAATLANVEATGVDFFGAGMSETHARESLCGRELNGIHFTFQGFNSIIPLNFPEGTPQPWPPDYLYVAKDTPIVKGGALELRDDNVIDFIDRAQDSFPIPVFHGGFEYGEYPSRNMRARMRTAVDHGAELLIAHHPHTIYGVATVEGTDPPVIGFLSLGNLVFDQDVFETFQSVLAIVEVEESEGDVGIRRAEMLPFHIEGYVPKAVSGDWSARIGRHMGHISTHLPATAIEGQPADGWKGLVVFPTAHRIAVCRYPDEYTWSETIESRTVELENGRSLPERYVRTDGADSLARIRASGPASVTLGRELLHYGDFEDFDVDDAYFEGRLWSQSPNRFVENCEVRNGLGAFVLLRQSNDRDLVETWLRNRVTFPIDARLTLSGWWKGRNAGRAEIVARYYLRDEREVVATFVIAERNAGTFDWERFDIDLVPPPEAGTVRFYFRQYPPERGDAALFLDDVALILWEDELEDVGAGVDLATPNNWSFFRVEADSAPEEIGVTLTHRVYRLVPPGAE